MASLRRTPSGSYIICFRYDGQQYQRSLKTQEPRAAEALKGRVEHTLFQLASGAESIPDGVDPGEYIVNGRTAPKPVRLPTRPPTFNELIEPYLDKHRGQKAASSLRTERTHLRNLARCLGRKADAPVSRLMKDDLDGALRKRFEAVEPTTVMKERQTLVLFIRWAANRQGTRLSRSIAEGLATFQEDTERDRFRTVVEIEHILARGGLTAEEVEALWECLYLDQIQVGEVLAAVKANARHDFIHPMVAIAAYTGMRRGEILRLRWSDVDFHAGLVTARSRKQSRQRQETSRAIDMHPELASVLDEYRRRRPHGQFVICRAGSTDPLTVHMAHDHLKRTLQGTTWERTITAERSKVVVGFHTFRHSIASNLAAAGVDQRVIDAIMGHQTEPMTRRYRHLFPASRRAAVEALSFSVSSTPSNSLG